MNEITKPEPDDVNPEDLITRLVGLGYSREDAIDYIVPLAIFAPEPSTFDYKAYKEIALADLDLDEDQRNTIYTDLVITKILKVPSIDDSVDVLEIMDRDQIPLRRVTISVPNKDAAQKLLDMIDSI